MALVPPGDRHVSDGRVALVHHPDTIRVALVHHPDTNSPTGPVSGELGTVALEP